MDSLQFLAPWVSTLTPVLPQSSLLRWAQPLFWAIVLAFLAAQVLAGRSQTVRRVVMAAAFAWAFLPGPWSPAWWMGLAFQAPSWTTVLLCAASVIAHWQRASGQQPTRTSLGVLGWLALGSGVLLLLDMFVFLPFALYRWGFSTLALTALLATATAVWVGAKSAPQKREAAVALMAMALYVLTRLPTGNVFDALLDPWLWLALMYFAVRQLFSFARSRS
jgi:hypothetical protein